MKSSKYSNTIDTAIEAMIILPRRIFTGRDLRELIKICNSSLDDKQLSECTSLLKKDSRVKCNNAVKSKPIYSYKGIC